MSKIEELRELIRKNELAMVNERTKLTKTAEEEKEADSICQTIHADGVAVVQQYGLPQEATTYSVRERLGSLFDRVNPFYVKRFRRHVEIPVVEEGQPSVYVQLREQGDAARQWLDVWIQPYGQKLRIYRGGGWDIVVRDTDTDALEDDPYRSLKKGTGYDPLKEAQEWRQVMDTVLKLRPIDRATIPAPLTQA